jgi:hypothetical protein
MFVQLVDASSVPTIINTDAIAHIQVSMKESQEDPTQYEFRRAVVTFNNPSQPMFLDEANYDILRNAIIPQ